MKRVLIYVEGQTEEAFVNRVLNPHFSKLGISLIPKIATTKKVLTGPDYKGGYIPYGKAKKEIKRLLGDSDVVAVTTMLDYYGLPRNYPGMVDIPEGSCYTRVEHLEGKLDDDISNRRFIPYLSLHEFEALLFTSPEEIDNRFPDLSIREEIEDITKKVQSPEEINEDQTTHPSAQLSKIIRTYRKPLDAPIIVQRIGVDILCRKCPHFNEWLTKLEHLG